MTRLCPIDFQTNGMFYSYPRSVHFFAKLEMDVISSSNTRMSQRYGLSHALLTSTMEPVIFLGPKKSCALIELKQLRKQHIAPLSYVCPAKLILAREVHSTLSVNEFTKEKQMS